MTHQKKKIEELIPNDVLIKLVENNQISFRSETGVDHVPVVKLYMPMANAKWLLTELDPETNIAFGLCDLGLGFPEIGFVSVKELLGRWTVLMDTDFKPSAQLSKYSEMARAAQEITV